MEKLDLSLIPVSELLEEVSSRCDFYACGYQLHNQSGPDKTIYTHWKDKAWFGNLALCEAVKADILQESFTSDYHRNEDQGEENEQD